MSMDAGCMVILATLKGVPTVRISATVILGNPLCEYS